MVCHSELDSESKPLHFTRGFEFPQPPHKVNTTFY